MNAKQPSHLPAALRPAFFSLVVIFASLASLVCVRPASAQCVPGMPFFQNISIEPGNPFQADYSGSVFPPFVPGTIVALPSQLRSVARDSQGRVRIEHFGETYKVKAADGTESELERHFVSICDPVSQNLIQLDSLNKTATIQPPRRNLPYSLRPGKAGQTSFCANVFALRSRSKLFQTEDLGQQLISGFNAKGLRSRLVREPVTAQGSSPSSYVDMWCSDDLGAVLLTDSVSWSASGTNRKSETLMQNIDRREPDPALFQIPSDYTILERTSGPPFLRPVPAPATPSTPSNPE